LSNAAVAAVAVAVAVAAAATAVAIKVTIRRLRVDGHYFVILSGKMENH